MCCLLHCLEFLRQLLIVASVSLGGFLWSAQLSLANDPWRVVFPFHLLFFAFFMVWSFFVSFWKLLQCLSGSFPWSAQLSLAKDQRRVVFPFHLLFFSFFMTWSFCVSFWLLLRCLLGAFFLEGPSSGGGSFPCLLMISRCSSLTWARMSAFCQINVLSPIPVAKCYILTLGLNTYHFEDLFIAEQQQQKWLDDQTLSDRSNTAIFHNDKWPGNSTLSLRKFRLHI